MAEDHTAPPKLSASLEYLLEELPGRVADEMELREAYRLNRRHDMIAEQIDQTLADFRSRPQMVITKTQVRESRGVPSWGSDHNYPGVHYINAPKKRGFWSWLFRKDEN